MADVNEGRKSRRASTNAIKFPTAKDATRIAALATGRDDKLAGELERLITDTRNEDGLTGMRLSDAALASFVRKNDRAILAALRALATGRDDKLAKRCPLGVGCDEYGVCYAEAHGEPSRCGLASTPERNAVIEDMRKKVANGIRSYLFEACQPDQGNVFSWCDDHAEEIAEAALRASTDERNAVIEECATYPRSWDEPWKEPPPPISRKLRDALKSAHERTLAMSPAEKRAMFAAQRQSFIRGMGPCEHGDFDWETCSECRALKDAPDA